MSVHTGPNNSENGLVFYYDMGNTQKSWKGKPTTNLITNSNNLTLWSKSGGITSVVGGYPDNEGTNSAFLVTANGTTNSYIGMSASLVSGNTYTKSVIAKADTTDSLTLESYDNNGAGGTAYFTTTFNLNNGTYSGSGHTASITSLGGGWYYCVATRAYTLNVGGGTFYIGAYGAGTGSLYLRNPQIEQNAFSTPFVNGTRSNTQAIVDLTGNNTIAANSLTYDPDGSFRFNAYGQRQVTNITTFGNNATWEAWIYCTNGSASTFNMFMGRYLPYFSFYSGNRLFFSNNIGGNQQTIQTSATLTANTWYHATFTTLYDGTNTTMKIYTNGVETSTGTFAGAQYDAYGYNFSIGDGYDANWYRFDGKVPVVKIYNRALSADEVSTNFNALRGRFGI